MNNNPERLQDIADKEILPLMMELINTTYDIFSHTKDVTTEFARDEYNIFMNGVLSHNPLYLVFTDYNTDKMYMLRVIQVLVTAVSPRDNNNPFGQYNYNLEIGWKTELVAEVEPDNNFMKWYINKRTEFNKRFEDDKKRSAMKSDEELSLTVDGGVYADDYCDIVNLYNAFDVLIEFIINSVFVSTPYGKCTTIGGKKYLYLDEGSLMWVYMKTNESIRRLSLAITRNGGDIINGLSQRKIMIQATADFYTHKVKDADEMDVIRRVFSNSDTNQTIIGMDLTKRARILTDTLGVININTI